MTCISTYKSCDVRSFQSIIKSSNFIDINNKVKEWMLIQEDYIFDVCVSNGDIVFHKNSYQSCVKIAGIIDDNNINDNEVFFKLYSLFEYLFINLEKCETVNGLKSVDISFVFEGFSERKLYKLMPIKKKLSQ